ncbi:MAG: hypothetical protein AMJ95_01115 [Omnitrophica WOR_2 bacterium SM23_72]|nr:MAG: hypothetical protein AMJ95_01115 [Omnitrophica WOR_2 bacterium SM23_72]
MELMVLFKYGCSGYKRFSKFLETSQWWPREKLEEYQAERLRTLIKYVYENVPYYQEIFRERELKPEDITSVSDLRKLPILTREDVINNFDKLIAKNISNKERKRRLILGYTSGSTGKPMIFYRDSKYLFSSISFMIWRNNLAHIKKFCRYIKLCSRTFIEKGIKDIKLYEPLLMRLSLSTVPTTMDRLEEYVWLIKRFKPTFLFGSASFLYTLACYARDKGYNDIYFRVFFSCYESLFSYQREIIERQFKCEIFNYYSFEEFLIFAVECDRHKGLHIEIRKGIMEIVGDNGEILPAGERGRIVCTGFDNEVMPLIRYETGDLGVVSGKPCSCARGLPLLISLDGRTSEILKYKNKYIFPSMLSGVPERISNIKECQFMQDKEDAIKINIVKRETYSSKDTEELTEILRDTIDKELNLEINFVNEIPRSTMGKFQFVINHLIH